MLSLYLILGSLSVYAQKYAKFDFETIVDKGKDSSHATYLQVLKQYNDYLNQNPRNIDVAIGRCKFIANAELDKYEKNPNYIIFDSCFQLLKKDFPNSPKAFLNVASNTWGVSLALVYDRAKISIEDNLESWTDSLKAAMFFEIAYNDYLNDESDIALEYAEKAAAMNDFYIGAWL